MCHTFEEWDLKAEKDTRIVMDKGGHMKRNWFVIPAAILLFWAMFMSALRYSVSSALGEWYVGRAYVLRMNDVIFASNEMNENSVGLQEEMLSDSTLRNISAVYMDSAAQSIATGTLFIEPDITKEEEQLLVRTSEKLVEYGMTVDEEGLMEMISYGTEAMNSYVSSLTNVTSPVIRIAALLHLYTVRPLFAGILSLASIVLFVLYAKHHGVSHTAIALLVTGALVLIAGFVVSWLSLPVTNSLLGRSVSISSMPFVVSGGLLIVLSLCLRMYSKKRHNAL